MDIRFERVSLPGDRELLIQFLTSEYWPYHVNSRLDAVKVAAMIESGIFDGSNLESHWIFDTKNSIVGFIRLMDLDDVDDGFPLFDLRIVAANRGRGIGAAAVSWLTNYLFERYAGLDRIVGTTRADNVAMRRVFRTCLFAKEGHFRQDWPSANGELFDTVRYGILRQDWMTKKVSPVNWSDEPEFT